MTKRKSFTAALAALSLLWVFAMPATAAGVTSAGEAVGWMKAGHEWSWGCGDDGRGMPADGEQYVEADELVYNFTAAVNAASYTFVSPQGVIRLCGNLTSSESDDDVHRALGAACRAAEWPRYGGEGGRGQIDYYNDAYAEPDVQITNLQWAPSMTGVLLGSGEYETLPAEPGSSSGTFLMQLHDAFIDTNCAQQSTSGMRAWKYVVSTFELIAS